MSQTMILVRCHQVSRTFGSNESAVPAVRDATCEIHAGEIIAVTGPSGSGKSTLLHLLAGLDDPTQGTVSWPGLGAREQLRPGPVAIVFQEPSLLPELDVLENVSLPLLLAAWHEEEAVAMARRSLARLGLTDLARKLPDEISGGQAQRVAVARALAARARLILADEPTGQLDQHGAAQVVRELQEAAVDTGAALVVTTHDHRMAARFPTRWPMEDGRLMTERGAAC
jgi:ABC-type lipoprotein export system ATPase subunit